MVLILQQCSYCLECWCQTIIVMIYQYKHTCEKSERFIWGTKGFRKSRFACIFTISWLDPCNKSSYIRFVYSQYHVDWLKCTEQNVNNQNLTQVSQLYVHVSFCLTVIRSWLNLPTGGHGHLICMLVFTWILILWSCIHDPHNLPMWRRGRCEKGWGNVGSKFYSEQSYSPSNLCWPSPPLQIVMHPWKCHALVIRKDIRQDNPFKLGNSLIYQG